MKKSIEQLEQEYAELINDPVLQRIGEWKLNNTDQHIDEDAYVQKSRANMSVFKNKCDSALKIFNEKK